MSEVNYIKHQKALFNRFYDDDRLNPSHISVYLALFQYWNMARFATTFSVARSEIMKLSKVKSKSTYSKCINELKDWGYIIYQPSNNPFKGSVFSLSKNWTTSEPMLSGASPNNGLPFTSTSPNIGPLLTNTSPNIGPPLVPYKTYKLNIINIKGTPENENNVIDFFLTEKSTKVEA